jgi:hypothetical protein
VVGPRRLGAVAPVLVADDDVVSGEAEELGQGAALLEDGDGVEAERGGDEGGRPDPAVALEADPLRVLLGLPEGDGEREAVLVLVAYCVGSTV